MTWWSKAYLGDPIEAAPAARAAGRDGDVVTALLEAEGLAAGYGKVTVVRDVDLEIREGEVVALLGPNGTGKTTTLLTLAGDLPPLGGTVNCLGLDGNASLHQRARAGLALVTDARAVFTRLTVAENLRVFRTTREPVVELFPELEAHLDRRVALLSGGQQQMLALGLALSRRPAVVLADELSMGLAPMIVDRLFAALRTRRRSRHGRPARRATRPQGDERRRPRLRHGARTHRDHGDVRGSAPPRRRDPVVLPRRHRSPPKLSLTRFADAPPIAAQAVEEALPRVSVGRGLSGAALHRAVRAAVTRGRR